MLKNKGQLLKTTAQTGPLPGRGLQQHRHPGSCRIECQIKGLGKTGKPSLHPVTPMGTGMDHHKGDAKLLTAMDFSGQGGNGFIYQFLLVAGQIDQVRGVRGHRQTTCLLPGGLKQRNFLCR